MSAEQTVVCMKWGTKYGPDYVNRLANMVRRHTARLHRLICFTDDATGLDPGVEAEPLPPIDLPDSHRHLGWRKIALTQAAVGRLSGRFLFIDLDVVILRSIDPFFDHAPEATYCVIENWTQLGRGIGNTSVFRLEVGAHTEVFGRLMADPAGTVALYPNSQTFKSRTIGSMAFWPAPWCVSFKHTVLPRFPLNYVRTAPFPHEARTVCFTGHPNPDEARDGRWPVRTWYKALYKRVRPVPWIGEHWR